MTGQDPSRDPSLTAAQRALVRANLGLVDDIAFRYFKRLASSSLDHLRSLGAAGLLDAARTYDETRGAQFRTYAWQRVRGAIRDGLRKDGRCASELVHRGVLSADEYAAWQSDRDETPHDAVSDVDNPFAHALLGYASSFAMGWIFGGRADDPEAVLERGARERAESAIESTTASLPERDRRVIELRNRQSLTWPEVAAALAVSEATAHRYYNSAMDRLGKRLEQLLPRSSSTISPAGTEHAGGST